MVAGFARTSSNAFVAPTKSSSAESPSASNAMSAMAISSMKRKAYDMGTTEGHGAPCTARESRWRTWNGRLMEFEGLREICKVPAPVSRDKHHVFDPHGAQSGIIEARLNGDDVPFQQQGSCATNARGFMNIQSDAMAGAMEVSLHAAVHQTRLVSGFFESLADATVNFHTVGAVLDLSDGFFLRIEHRLVQPLELGTRRSAYDRARHICKVP